jgi:kynurenine formamidase
VLAKIQILNQNFEIDLSKPIDISIPLSNSDKNPIAWYLDKPEISPVVSGDWIGKVSSGNSSTNFNNIYFNPHGHGTHTECLGHITREFYSINDCLKQFFFLAELISVEPEVVGEDLIITKSQIELLLSNKNRFDALIIRTLPNKNDKLSKKYSNKNPPYLSEEAAIYIREIGIKHLLIDLPSVDKERDEGKLLAHKAFWNVKNVNILNEDARLDCTITELIFVDDKIPDANYLLNLQIANFVNDASPSKPVLYEIS